MTKQLNFKNFDEMLDYFENNEPEIRSDIGATAYNQLFEYAAVKVASKSFKDQYAQSDIERLDYLQANKQQMEKTEFNNYWNYHSDRAFTQLKYANNALSVTDTGFMENWSSVSDNSILKNTYQYDLADDEDIWRQENGFAPKAIDSDIKRISSKGYRASKFYTNDENGAILNNLYSYDAEDPEDALNLILGRTPKAFKYDTTDEDKARERDGLLPIAAETYISNSKQFAAEYTDYAAKMQEYANKKYEYDNLPWLTKLFTAEPQKPYSGEEMPATIQALMQYKNEIAVADELAQVEGRDFFSETGKNEQKINMPHFMFDESVPIMPEEFFADEPTVTKQKYKQDAQQTVNIGGMTGTGLISGNAYTFTVADALMPSIDKMADARMQGDIISELKSSGEYEKIMQQQDKILEQTRAALEGDYTPDKYNLLKDSLDMTTELGFTGGMNDVKDATQRILMSGGVDMSQNPLLTFASGADITQTDATGSYKFVNDEKMKEIRAQLDALGWDKKPESDNPEIQELIDQARYRVVQLQKDEYTKNLEAMSEHPSWLIAVISGMGKGANSFAEGVSSVALETAKLALFGALNETLDPAVEGLAKKSMEIDRLARQNVSSAQGASGVTDFIYDVTSTATEMGINLAIGGALAGATAPEATASALTGWKAVASKVLTIRPQTAPLFISSLGHNLMQGELEGRTDAEKWLQSVPAAYFETIIEQSVGFFSGRSAPIATLIKNGTKGAAAKTLGNVAISLLENTVGEAIEENLQDITGEFFRDIMWSDDYKANYLDWDQIGDTTKTTIAVGLLMSLFGLPSSAKSFNVARNAEASFNKAVDAYKSGDTVTFNSAMSDLKTQYAEGLDMMQADAANGTLQDIIKTTQGEANTNVALIEMRDATRAAMELRSAKAGGVDIAQSAIDIADARANQAIQNMRVGVMGRAEAPTTLYDQIATSEELTRMANRGGLASRLIAQNQVPLTDLQVQVLRDVETMAQRNPYVDVAYTESTTPETLQNEINNYAEKTQSAQVELKSLNDMVEKEIQAAYSKSTALGQMKYSEMIRSGVTKDIEKLSKSVGMYQQRLIESKSKFAGYSAQTEFMQRFADFSTQAAVSPVEPITTTEGQTQAETDIAPQNTVATMPDRAVPMQGTVNDIIGSAEPLSSMVQDVEQDDAIAQVLTNVTREKQTLGQAIKNTIDFAKRKFVDTGANIADIAKKTGDSVLYPLYNNAKQARQAAQYMIGVEQFDINGNTMGQSLIDIFAPVRANGEEYTQAFFDYLLHNHNIDRMAQGKPVFGESVTAEDSRAKVAEYEAQYPEFAELARGVYTYNDNLMQWRVDSKRITQEQADAMKEMYPHYVPTYRMMPKTAGASASGGSISVANTLNKAKGSNLDIMPLDESMARQTLQVVEMAKTNVLGNRLLGNILANTADLGEYVGSVEVDGDVYDIDAETEGAGETKNTIKIYRDGEVATLKVSSGVFEGFKDLAVSSGEINYIMKAAQAFNSTFKKLVTGYNPVFTVRNFFRDLQDAGINTRDMGGFMANFPVAYKEMVTNGEYWQLYQKFGGLGSSFFDYERGIKTEKDSAVKRYTVGMVENVNMAIEQAPRLAEFIATIKKGGMSYDNIMQAVYNAAEVTVNFGRSGSWGRVINKTFVPFFNPAIQGTSRLIRRFTETKGVKEWTVLAIRAAVLGMAPSLINSLLYSDDDEYEIINNRDKDRYYLFKMGDGNWAKIPKGRVLSLFGGFANRAVGNYDDADVAGFIELAKEQIAPISPFESNITSPFAAIANNKTWYGTDIESQYLEDNFAPGQRYDESTDAFSKWLGEATNFSPKKINYLIDQYTGVIGDVLLPATTPRAEKDPFTAAFTLDVKTSNKLSTEFYEIVDKIKYDVNSGDTAKASKAKADNKIIQKYASDISELNKLIRSAQNSDKPDDEKLAIVRDLKATIGALQQSALKMLKD